MEAEFVPILIATLIFFYLNYPGVQQQFVDHEMALMTPEQRAALEQMQAANAAMAAASAPKPPTTPSAPPPPATPARPAIDSPPGIAPGTHETRPIRVAGRSLRVSRRAPRRGGPIR